MSEKTIARRGHYRTVPVAFVTEALVNGEWHILTPYRIETPKPIDKKFCTRDYVREATLCTKFGENPTTEGFWANR